MTKGRKTGGRNFVKGVVTNPNGRPKTPEALRNLKRLTKVAFEEIVNKYLWCSLSELEKYKKANLPVMDAWVVSIIHKGVLSGDWSGNEWIAQRIIGKVKDQIEVTTVKPFIVEDLSGNHITMGATFFELPESKIDPNN